MNFLFASLVFVVFSAAAATQDNTGNWEQYKVN